MTDTGTQTAKADEEGSSPGGDRVVCLHQNRVVCLHQCCTTDQCMSIPEAGYACLPEGSHACCGACYKHQFWMPVGGYNFWIPIPHDDACDKENPVSASWEPRRRKTEEVYLRKKEVERQTREVFQDLCDHPWGYTDSFLSELGAPTRTPAEEYTFASSASGSNNPWFSPSDAVPR